jgi:hypothetical protein
MFQIGRKLILILIVALFARSLAFATQFCFDSTPNQKSTFISMSHSNDSNYSSESTASVHPKQIARNMIEAQHGKNFLIVIFKCDESSQLLETFSRVGFEQIYNIAHSPALKPPSILSI